MFCTCVIFNIACIGTGSFVGTSSADGVGAGPDVSAGAGGAGACSRGCGTAGVAIGGGEVQQHSCQG